MTDDEFDLDLSELSSAEDFLDYFAIAYDPAAVQIHRLHILQRFHDSLAQVDELPDSTQARWALHAKLLQAAYQDFLVSDAATEKVFRVFKTKAPRSVSVPFGELKQHAPPV